MFIPVSLVTALAGLRVASKYLNQCHCTCCLIKMITYQDVRETHGHSRFIALGASQAQMAFC